MKKVETYQVTQGPLDPSGTDRWTEATLYLGVLAAYYVTKDPQYLTDATTWSSKNKYALLTTTAADYADNWTAGQVYTELYLLDPTANASDITASKAAVDAVTASPPTLLWYWCDALFMAPGLVVRLGAADATSGGATYYSFLDNEWTQTYTVLYDPTQKLFWRDATTKANTPTTYWSRGNGWVMAGTARVLEYLPQTDVQRSAYVTLLQNMASAVAPLQGSDGLWRSNLLDANAFPNPETSGTGLMTFAMAWGINNGVLDGPTYRPVVDKAWSGLVANVNSAGMLQYVQAAGSAPAAAKQSDTFDYGVGAFLLAASEVAKLP